MFRLLDLPAFWGFWGSLVYAGGRLTSVLFGEARINRRSVLRAWSLFAIAIVFGPLAAQAFGPTVLDWVGHKARPQAVYFTVGLSINAVWPTIEQIAWRAFWQWVGAQLQEVGKKLSGDERLRP